MSKQTSRALCSTSDLHQHPPPLPLNPSPLYPRTNVRCFLCIQVNTKKVRAFFPFWDIQSIRFLPSQVAGSLCKNTWLLYNIIHCTRFCKKIYMKKSHENFKRKKCIFYLFSFGKYAINLFLLSLQG